MRIDARTVLSVLGDIRPQIRFLRSKNVAIVHSNDGRTHATWALTARLAGAKLLWHPRGNPGARGLRFAAPQFGSTSCRERVCRYVLRLFGCLPLIQKTK